MAQSRGEVWLVSLDPTIGDEIRKTRPAIIVSREAIGVLALRIIVPITSWQPRFQGCDWLVRLDPDDGNGLDKPSAVDTFQVRSIATRRFVRLVGRVTASDLERVSEGLKTVLDI